MASGYSGGAKDTVSFQRSIGRGFLPLASSIEYEGLYNEFYFDIGRERDKIFAPKYKYCKSEDPFSKEKEHYIAIGLTSKYDGEGLKIHGRNPFNLVVAVDVSGSMSAPLDKEDDKRSKMEITVNAIFSIIALLKPGDRFGVVTFNDEISVVQELELIENIDIPKLKSIIVSLTPNGGTSLSAAMKKSTRMFDEVKKDTIKYKESENTIVVLTDVVPSAKDASTATFINTVQNNSLLSLYTTFIGIGSEFSSDLLKKLGKIRSCNYYSVHNAADFKRIVDLEFVYILSPIAFNISITINSEQFVVERVYGSPGNELPSASGEMLKIECVGPSPVDENDKTKGGIVLAKLKLNSTLSSPSVLRCNLQYEDRNGNIHKDEQIVEVPLVKGNFFEGEAARKSILLTRYVNISKHWIMDETKRIIARENEDTSIANYNNDVPVVPQHTISLATGITPPPLNQEGKRQRRISFYVDFHYSELFKAFVSYFKDEISQIGDPLLEPCIGFILLFILRLILIQADILTLEKMANFEQTVSKSLEGELQRKKTSVDAIEFFVIEKGEKIELTKNNTGDILRMIATEGRYILLNKIWDELEKNIDPQGLQQALLEAGQNGHPKILHRVLTLYKSLVPRVTSENILDALVASVKKGHLACVKELLLAVPDFEITTHGSNLLTNAYNYGKSICAKYLIEQGATADGITLADIEKDLNPTKVNKNELDLVFCCDCTGSMGAYLKSAQQSIIKIASSIASQGECDVRFGLVKYRDHPPQDYSYITEEHDFTRETKRMQAYVNTMSAEGGGDGPECLVDGMEKCVNMEFRPTATKIICIITDAPPHGLYGFSGDGFPEGCPCGHDPLEVARAMSESGLVVYTLGVNLSDTDCLKPFLAAVAKITEGQYAPLSSADLLSNVIVGGSIEEIELNNLSSLVKQEWENIVPLSLDLDDSLLLLYENLQKKDIKVKQMQLDDVEDDRVNVFVGASNLEEAAKQLALLEPPKNSVKREGPEYKLVDKIISLKQVTRVWNRFNVVH